VYSGHDLCVFSDDGQVQAKLEAKVAVDGVQAYACSVLQRLLFVLFDSGRLAVYCTRTADCALVGYLPADSVETRRATCMVLCEVVPREAQDDEHVIETNTRAAQVRMLDGG
jgi:hypothetical protein